MPCANDWYLFVALRCTPAPYGTVVPLEIQSPGMPMVQYFGGGGSAAAGQFWEGYRAAVWGRCTAAAAGRWRGVVRLQCLGTSNAALFMSMVFARGVEVDVERTSSKMPSLETNPSCLVASQQTPSGSRQFAPLGVAY